jgi:MoaA/NifB/PqqE/SkfB family radical SAM enzyme
MEQRNTLNIVEGWHHSMREYIEAHRKDTLLKLVIHLSNVCNLSCPGCFVNRPDDDVSEKRKARRHDEMSFEDQKALLQEAKQMGVKTIDIVGAGEPTLDPHFEQFVNEVEKLGMDLVVFTHGATKIFKKENLVKYRDKPISFIIKLWSLDQDKMDQYVRGALKKYAQMRDEAIQNLEELGFMQGKITNLNGKERQITRVGADVLVMKSNNAEIPDIFRFCRKKGIMPIIKTYIPQGPTKLDHQNESFAGLSTEEQEKLKADAVTPTEFDELRKQLEKIDEEEFSNEKLEVFYPQGVFCTQSAGSLYVTINGDILSCVGTGHIYGKYQPETKALSKTIRDRIEKVGLGCIPRIEEAKKLRYEIPEKERKILEMGSEY